MVGITTLTTPGEGHAAQGSSLTNIFFRTRLLVSGRGTPTGAGPADRLERPACRVAASPVEAPPALDGSGACLGDRARPSCWASTPARELPRARPGTRRLPES